MFVYQLTWELRVKVNNVWSTLASLSISWYNSSNVCLSADLRVKVNTVWSSNLTPPHQLHPPRSQMTLIKVKVQLDDTLIWHKVYYNKLARNNRNLKVENTLCVGIQEFIEYHECRPATGIFSNKIILILRNKNFKRFSIVNFLL